MAGVTLWYSWNNQNWTQLAANPAPLNPVDTEGNPLPINQTGPLYLQAHAYDLYGHDTTATKSMEVRTDGFLVAKTNPGYYNYQPAVILDAASNTMYAWWTVLTSLPGGGDAITYAQCPVGGSWSTPTDVITTTDWNNGIRLISTPTVVKGSFSFKGSPYTYAMYYVESKLAYNESNPSQTHCYNVIGLAYSNNPGTGWQHYTTPGIPPYSSPIVESSCTTGDGVSCPSVIRIGASYYMFYNDWVNSSSTVLDTYYRTSSDGVSWSDATKLNYSGIPNINGQHSNLINPSFAYAPSDGCIYMAHSEANAMKVYKISLSAIAFGSSASWSAVYTYPAPAGTYIALVGLIRDANGCLPDTSHVCIAFSSSSSQDIVGTKINYWIQH